MEIAGVKSWRKNVKANTVKCTATAGIFYIKIKRTLQNSA